MRSPSSARDISIGRHDQASAGAAAPRRPPALQRDAGQHQHRQRDQGLGERHRARPAGVT
jgi:hypothetical protein